MVRRALILPALVGLLFCSATMTVAAASFDCAKATAPDEHAICADPNLSTKDTSLAYLYTTLQQLLKGDGRQQLVDSQRDWLQARANCGNDAPCIAALYDRETKRLQSLLEQTRSAVALDLFRETGQCLGCKLSGADLSGIAPALHADKGLVGCNVNAVANGVFTKARIDHANFVTCRTKYDSALETMSWDNARLEGTDFTQSNLGGDSFHYADLSEANLSGANLYLVDMRDAKLARAKLVGVQAGQSAMSGLCATFAGADFSEADLEKAKLCGDFRGANFTGADLRDANLSGYAVGVSNNEAREDVIGPGNPPPSSGIRFGGKINLGGANLRGATLFGETKLPPHGYGFAILCHTTLPDGTISDRDCK